MKAQRPYPQITITPKGEAALVGGHPWVYEGEVTGLSGPVSDGQLVDVISRRGSWLGCGFSTAAPASGYGCCPGTPTTGSTGPSGGGASSTHGTTVKPLWGRRIAAAAG